MGGDDIDAMKHSFLGPLNRYVEREAPVQTLQEDNTVFTEVTELLKPGQLCKVMVRKATGLSWELCRRKYDALQAPIAYGESLCFRLTSEAWIQRSFRAREMPVDLCVERIVIHRVPQDMDYRWFEIWTRHENYCIQIYPLPLYSTKAMVRISTLSRRFLTFLERPLCLGEPIFENECLPDSLKAPLERMDPLFDIERRIRSGGPLSTEQDSFRLVLKTREGLLKVRLDYHVPLKIPYLDGLEPYALQQRFLKQFLMYWMTLWEYTAEEHWYFSCRFENLVAGRLKIQVLGLQVDVSQKALVPWVFTCHEQNMWTAFALKGSAQPHSWQPEPLFQQILMHQPLTLNMHNVSDYFYGQGAVLNPSLLPPYQEESWQRFEEDSRFLRQIFALLVRQMSRETVDSDNATLAQLLSQMRLAKETRRVLTQRFEIYQSQIQQLYPHADAFSAIQNFWESFFQAFFGSLEIPDSFLKGTALGSAYTVTLEKPFILRYFETQNTQGESLVWSLRWDIETQSGTLLDINRRGSEGVPQRQVAFTFMQDYQALPLCVKAFIEPYWRYFKPVAHQLNQFNPFNEGM